MQFIFEITLFTFETYGYQQNKKVRQKNKIRNL